MTQSNSLAILNSSAPYACTAGKDALDIALIFASFELAPALFFQADGVYQLMQGQDGGKISVKDYLKTFAAFEFYDIEEVFVCQSSLTERGLNDDFHIENVQVLKPQEFAEQLAQYSTLLRF